MSQPLLTADIFSFSVGINFYPLNWFKATYTRENAL